MKIQLKTSQLSEALSMMAGFVSKNSTLPILENIYLRWGIDTITFRGTDMEKYIEIEIPAFVSDEWAITINAKTFNDIVKSITDEDIELNIDTVKQHIKVKSKSDDFSIKGLPASEYVSLPEVKQQIAIDIPISYLVDGITKTEYAIIEKNFSPVLTGLLLRLRTSDDQKHMIFVGTDSFRLAEYKIRLETTVEDFSLIVPKANIVEIKRVCEILSAKNMEHISLQASENLVAFSGKIDGMSVLMTSLLIQGNFPEYDNENIVPRIFRYKIMLNKDLCDKAIKKIWILTKDINNYVQISTQEQAITIQSGLTDMWEWVTQLVAYVEATDPISFWLNGKYVSDMIRMCKAKDIIMNISEPHKPISFTDSEDSHYTYIIRPLNK